MTRKDIPKTKPESSFFKDDLREVKRILASLNKFCRHSKIGRHYGFKKVLACGYMVKCSFSKSEQINSRLSSLSVKCNDETSLYSYLQNELVKLSS